MRQTTELGLRGLLSQCGSYARIALAARSGWLPQFPVRLFDHIGDVYERVETAAGEDFAEIVALRLTSLLHEEPSASLRSVLESAEMMDLAPVVMAVTGEFGQIWKVRTEQDIQQYVDRNGRELASILLFELAHEGRATSAMKQAAAMAGLHPALERWEARLVQAAFPSALVGS